MVMDKKGSFILTILVVILILLVVGLWYYADFTKDVVTGAISRGKDLVP